MKHPTYNMKGKMWLHSEMPGSWYFVALPKKQSKEIQERYGDILRRGWGSVRVRVTIGKTSWNTSIFPDKKLGTYLLPIKKEVREKENIAHDSTISYSIEIKI